MNLKESSIVNLKKTLFLSFFYPIINMILVPKALILTIKNCKSLFYGKYSKISSFSPQVGINSFFYYRNAIELKKNGRFGISNLIGYHPYKLSSFFHYSLPSLFLFKSFKAYISPICFILWFFAHLTWVINFDFLFVIIPLSLLVFSTLFYHHLFLTNYNAVGWAFFSLFIYSCFSCNYFLSSLLLLLISFGSFTVLLLSFIVFGIHVLEIQNSLILIYIIPSLISILINLYPIFYSKNINIFSEISKFIGLNRRGVKYKRKIKFGLFKFYWLMLIMQFIIASYFIKGEFNVYLISVVVLFLLNSTFLRFADDEHIEIYMLSISVFYLITNFSVYLLPSFWILMSPIPYLTGSFVSLMDINKPWLTPVLKPFNYESLEKGLDFFFSHIEKNKNILFAFDDPKNDYRKIFDGYRFIMELPYYVVNKNNSKLFPDWYAVSQNNYENGVNFWGRSTTKVSDNLKKFQTKYVVIYQENKSTIDEKWKNSGYKLLSSFDWVNYKNVFLGNKIILKNNSLSWFLLEKIC